MNRLDLKTCTIPIAILLVSAGLALGPRTAGAEETTREQVQAAFIYKFTRFIQWPDSALQGTAGEFPVCVAGQGPMSEALSLIEGKAVNGRRLTIRRKIKPQKASNCLILFISRSESNNFGTWRKALKGRPILLIGDWPGFGVSGGHIEFYMDSSYVRFAINFQEARDAGLKISSKLLQLARIVETRKTAEP